MKKILSLIFLLAAISITSCRITPSNTPIPVGEGTPQPLTLTSSAFTEGDSIPAIYSCLEGISPALAWGEPPAGTKSFAVIMDDPDAPHGTFLHWVIFNIPPESRGLPEKVPNNVALADGSLQGQNGLAKTGYVGPCPPVGTHRYSFRLYALDIMLDSSFGSVPTDERQSELDAHTLAKSELIGTYKKP